MPLIRSSTDVTNRAASGSAKIRLVDTLLAVLKVADLVRRFRRTALVNLMVVGVLLALQLAVAIPAAAQVGQGATMTVLQGSVAVIRTNGSAVQPAPSGTEVFPGDEIRTLNQSGALITFFAGTEIELGA